MVCYRSGCESHDLRLAALTEWERQRHREVQLVLRVCYSCGLEQNHYGDDEPLPLTAAIAAAPIKAVG